MIAKYLATSLAIEKVVSAPLVMRSCLPISTTSMSLVGLESRSTMLPASLAATVPVFMATPTSAWARAGASLVPSPVIATSLPPACSRLFRSSLFSGVAWARTSSTPAALVVTLLGEHHDRAALRRLVGQRGELGGVHQLLDLDPRQGKERGRLPVAQRDRAGLVQQQGVDVAGRLDRPAGHGQHVLLHHPVHAGDADRRQQPADGGRDKADQQRDQHHHLGAPP